MFILEYEKACEAALAAGKVIAGYANSHYEIHHKTQDQPVTIADREANQTIQKIIQESFPYDGWLSEETLDNPARLKKPRVWIIDPLDGTKEFINKVPEYAVSIALVIDGDPVVGAIYNPMTKELFSCKKEGGAFLNGKSISVSVQKNISQSKILASRSESGRGEWKKYEKKFTVIPCGSMAYKMAVVACGRADGSFSLTPKTEWDFAAGVLLVEEAGGKVTEVGGAPFRFNKKDPRASGILYANPAIYKELQAMLG